LTSLNFAIHGFPCTVIMFKNARESKEQLDTSRTQQETPPKRPSVNKTANLRQNMQKNVVAKKGRWEKQFEQEKPTSMNETLIAIVNQIRSAGCEMQRLGTDRGLCDLWVWNTPGLLFIVKNWMNQTKKAKTILGDFSRVGFGFLIGQCTGMLRSVCLAVRSLSLAVIDRTVSLLTPSSPWRLAIS
jgi:hypothetical protein